MAGSPPSGSSADDGRLNRCIRDLAALNALPSMCIGRSPEETLDIMLDALPTALSCDFIYLRLPGSPPTEQALLGGVSLGDDALAMLRATFGDDAERSGRLPLAGHGDVWYAEAEVPLGARAGLLVVGRQAAPLNDDTDRVLVRAAANLVGTTLESARVLEVARRKDDFLAMLGHELRNPLGPIVTAVELLGRHPEAARERHVIERHTRHLARLVDDLLDISRVTRGHVEMRSEEVSLASVLDRAVEITGPLLARQRHVLQVADAEGLTLRGDSVRLAQVFANLLVNAAKFTPPLGRIEVLVQPLANRVRVTVRDTGVGIARDQLARIFEPFVQAERERDALHGGLGLGLAIVKNLVERHGGNIGADSEGHGRGARFVVELPTIVASQTTAAIVLPASPIARGGVRVLVVDDNVDLADLFSEALRVEGFETAVEHDARSALERWRRFVPHAAVLDVGLPEVDGYELARTLRAEHGHDPMLIAATGYGQPKDRLRAVDAGFDCHFVKPVSVRDIVHVLDQRVVRAAPT